MLCRELTGRFWPSLVGGYLFGFSSFMLAESLAHLHLTLSFPVPWALLLAVRRFRGSISRRRYVGWLAVVLALQVLFSTEAALMLAVMSCAGAVAFLAFADAAARRRLAGLLAEAVAAGAIAAVLVAPYLYYAFKDVRPDPIRSPYLFSGDALNLLIPTRVTRLGHQTFAPVADRFVANAAESGLYVGLPIVGSRSASTPCAHPRALPSAACSHSRASRCSSRSARAFRSRASRRSSCRGARR